jgi:hypothetical protein
MLLQPSVQALFKYPKASDDSTAEVPFAEPDDGAG